VETLLEAGRGHVRMVTLAPEIPGALEAIGRLVDAGSAAAIGHTDATHEQAVAALDAGASVGTHLFNAMRPLHHREPGPAGALLAAEEARVELVADGVHVHRVVIGLAAAVAPGRLVLVTDAMAAAAAEDGNYALGGLRVTVRDGVARLDGTGAIAGSTSTLLDCVRYAVLDAGLSLEVAIAAATSTPASLLGLEGVGELRPGGHADLVVLDDDLGLRGVLRRGVWVR
jgi:N-acetylglucosamine-6-phosphate deacetylase